MMAFCGLIYIHYNNIASFILSISIHAFVYYNRHLLLINYLSSGFIIQYFCKRIARFVLSLLLQPINLSRDEI